MKSPIAACLALLLLVSALPLDAKRLPSWLEEARQWNDSQLELNADAVVLLESRETEFLSDGDIRRKIRFAMRVRNQDGRQYAQLKEFYNSEHTKIRDLDIWIIRSNGKIEDFDRKDCADFSISDNLYSEEHTLAFAGESRVRPGDIFAFELEMRGSTIFGTTAFTLQRSIPVIRLQARIKPPQYWTVRSMTLNGGNIEPTVKEGFYTWLKEGIPGLDLDEEMLPELIEYTPRLVIGLEPGPEVGQDDPYLYFASWNAVARHMAELMDPPAEPNDLVTAKARELVAGLDDPLQRIAAIARFTQALRYVSIEMNISVGGGYIPFPAAEVLRCSYGDCKDKTALMRALLKAVGIRSYSVSTNVIGVRQKVISEWPSMRWFDHCIVAVEAPEDYSANAVIRHPQLGSLILFDPTNPDIPLGEFPPPQFGGQFLVHSPLTLSLSEVPPLGLSLNRVENRISAKLDSYGNLVATFQHTATGQQALRMRSMYRQSSPTDFEKRVRQMMVDEAPGIEIIELEVDSPADELRIDLTTQTVAPLYARPIGNYLLVFKPTVFWRLRWIPPDLKRDNPFKFKDYTYVEITEVTIPEGFAVDEIGGEVSIEESFASYSTRIRQEGERIVFEKEIQIREALLPVEQYGQIREFYRQVIESENTPVVLARN